MVLGYTFLMIAVLAGCTKGYFGKQISGKTQGMAASVWANVLRMGFCIVISLLVGGVGMLRKGLSVDLALVLTGVLSGVMMAFFVVSWLYCVRGGTYMLVNISLMLGMLVTLILSNLFLSGETVTLIQWGGVALLIGAVLVMYSYNKGMRGKMRISSLLLLLACGVSNGLCDFSQKLFQHYSKSDTALFTLITYFVTLLVLLAVLGLPQVRREQVKPLPLIKELFFYVLIMAVCLFLNSYFKTEAAAPGRLTAAQLYPVSESVSMLLSVLMSHFLLKEKATPRCITGCVLALAAVLLLK